MTRTVVLVGILTILAHLGGVLGGPEEGRFVYDDRRFVVENDALREVGRPWRFLDPTTAGPGWDGIYRPLRTLSFAVDRMLGMGARGMRFESVVLHGLAAALLASVLLDVTGRPFAAGVGGLVFGLHPVTAEVSSWISSRGDVLALVFGLVAVILHLREAPLGAAFVFLMACLAKESVVVLPVLLLPLDVARGATPLRSGRSRFAYGALAVTAVAYLTIRTAALAPHGAFFQDAPAGWMGRRAAGFLRDLLATALPVGLGFDLQVTSSALLTALAILATLALLALVWWLGRRGRRLAAAGIAWYLLALAIYSLPFAPLKIATADRFLYVSLAGAGMFVAGLLARARPRPSVVVPAGAMLLLLGVLTLQRTPVYASEGALFQEALATDPGNVRALEGLAFAAREEGRLPEAMERYEAYLAVVPEDAKAHAILAGILRRLGRRHEDIRSELWADALAQYREAVNLWEAGGAPWREEFLGPTCVEGATLSLVVGDPGLAEGFGMSAVEAPGTRGKGLDLLVKAACMWIEKGRIDAGARAVRTRARLGGDTVEEVVDRMEAWWGPRAPAYGEALARMAEELR